MLVSEGVLFPGRGPAHVLVGHLLDPPALLMHHLL